MQISISGIRGIFGHDFLLENAIEFCNGFSNIIKSKKCAIANDVRPSSKIIKNVSSAALMQNGIDVYDLGVMPTPVVFHESRNYGSGMMITASHNTIAWNGIKYSINGKGVNNDQIKTIKNSKMCSRNLIGEEIKINTKYVEDMNKIIKNDYHGRKLIIDVCGGTSKQIISEVLNKYKHKSLIINDDVTNLKYTDPVHDKLDNLIMHTSNNKIGFALDIDGDRLVVVKNKKKMLPDLTVLLCIAKSIELGYKKFVVSLDTSIIITEYIIRMGCKVYYSKVGERNVVEQIEITRSHAGGEGSSGGFILPEFNYCRDGILSCVLIASMKDANIEKILNTSKSFIDRYKLNIRSDVTNDMITGLSEKIKSYNEIRTYCDGIKIIFDKNSWALIRRSNTENNTVRISIETNQKNKTMILKKKINVLIKDAYDQIKRKRNYKNFSERISK